MSAQHHPRSQRDPNPLGAASESDYEVTSRSGNATRPLVAAVMSACLPGFGQLFNGQVNRALWLFIAFCIVVAPASAFVALAVPAWAMTLVMALWLLAAICVWAWNIADAWRGAKRMQTSPRPWQMSGVYALVFLACVGLVLPTIVGQVREDLVHPVRIVGDSMSPTLQAGDQLFVNRRVNCIGCAYPVKRGDIVIFTFPNNRTQLHIKRVIGLPGDTVAVNDQGVSVNGKPLEVGDSDDGLRRESVEAMSWQITPPTGPQQAEMTTVPNGHAFVLGDNRGESKDSRAFGPVPLADIHGRARQIYFSADNGSINWSRIGEVVN